MRHTGKNVVVVLSLMALGAFGSYLFLRPRIPQGEGFTDGEGTISAASLREEIRLARWRDPELLDAFVSGDDETEPCFDEATGRLFFSVGGRGGNADLWMAESDENGSPSMRRLAELNTRDDESSPVVQGGFLYFSSDRPGGAGGQDLYRSRIIPDGFLEAENLGPGVNSPADEVEAAFRSQAGELFFASNRGHHESGDFNLFACKVVGTSIGNAHLVEEVQTPYDERSPTFGPLGRALVFSSNRPGGSGGFDFYRSLHRNGVWMDPENLGAPNSVGDELGADFADSGFTLYFSSDRTSEAGQHDLYVARTAELYAIPGSGFSLTDLTILILLALVALLAFLARRWETLDVIYKCLLLSLLIHLLILWLTRRVDIEVEKKELIDSHPVYRVELLSDLLQTLTSSSDRERGTEVAELSSKSETSRAERAAHQAKPMQSVPEVSSSSMARAELQSAEAPARPSAASRTPTSSPAATPIAVRSPSESYERMRAPAKAVAVSESRPVAPRSTTAAEAIPTVGSSADLPMPAQQPAASTASVARAEVAVPRAGPQKERPVVAATPDLAADRAVAMSTPSDSVPLQSTAYAGMQAAPSQNSPERSDSAQAPARQSTQVASSSVAQHAPSGSASMQRSAAQPSAAPTRQTTAASPKQSQLAQAPSVNTRQATDLAEPTVLESRVPPVAMESQSGLAANLPREGPRLVRESSSASTAVAANEVSSTAAPVSLPPATSAAAAAPARAQRELATPVAMVQEPAPSSLRFPDDRTTPSTSSASLAGAQEPTPAKVAALTGRLARDPGGGPERSVIDAPSTAQSSTSASLPVLAKAGTVDAQPPARQGSTLREPVSVVSAPVRSVQVPEDRIAQATADTPGGSAGEVDPPMNPSSSEVALQSMSSSGRGASSVAAGPTPRELPKESLAMPRMTPEGRTGNPLQRFTAGHAEAPSRQASELSASLASPRFARNPMPELRTPGSEASNDLPSAANHHGQSMGNEVRPFSLPPLNLAGPSRAGGLLAKVASIAPAGRRLNLVAAAPRADVTAPARSRTADSLPKFAHLYSRRSGDEKLKALREGGGSAETEAAVLGGLRYLATVQREDGFFGDAYDSEEARKYGDIRVGKTGLAALAFLGAGHTPSSGTEFSGQVSRALRWILGQQDAGSGHFGDTAAYSHGIATYALAECYAMTNLQRLRGPLEKAVAHILEVQKKGARDKRLNGGWTYYYKSGPGFDSYPRASISAWQVMALESARVGGIEVPDRALSQARSFFKQSFDPDTGYYRYTHNPEWLDGRRGYRSLPASTPASIFVLTLLGERDSKAMDIATEFVLDRRPRRFRRNDDGFVPRAEGNLYFWYYGTLAMFFRGGESWSAWNRDMKKTLLPSQNGDGSWRPISPYAVDYAGDDNRDRSYTTAMCVLSLEVYYRYFTPLLSRQNEGR